MFSYVSFIFIWELMGLWCFLLENRPAPGRVHRSSEFGALHGPAAAAVCRAGGRRVTLGMVTPLQQCQNYKTQYIYISMIWYFINYTLCFARCGMETNDFLENWDVMFSTMFSARLLKTLRAQTPLRRLCLLPVGHPSLWALPSGWCMSARHFEKIEIVAWNH